MVLGDSVVDFVALVAVVIAPLEVLSAVWRSDHSDVSDDNSNENNFWDM